MKKILPTGDRMILQKIGGEEMYGDIIIPDSKQINGKPVICKVKAMGPNCSTWLEEDDEVVISQYSGTKFRYLEEEFIVIDEEHILGVYN